MRRIRRFRGVAVGYNFRVWDREQLMLLPPRVDEWLPADHLALFIVDVVDQFDLDAFFAAYRDDGWGRSAYHPQMMVTLLVYAYCLGVLSSRQIETACRDDLAFRVICANQVPDHTTICRFRQNFEEPLKDLFVQVLGLCAEAGLAEVGLVAVDGTKMEADAALRSNRAYQAICAELEERVAKLLAEAEQIDAAEDERLGERRGDELPEGLTDRDERIERLAEAKRQLEEKQAAERAAYEAHLAEREAMERERGSKLRGRKPKDPGEKPPDDAKANVTDPDSRIMKNAKGFVQGYNGQALVNENQIVLACHLTQDANDVAQLHPMIEAAQANLAAIGVTDRLGTVLADAGYFSEDNLTDLAPDGPRLLVATKNDRKLRKDAKQRETTAVADDDNDDDRELSARQRMEQLLATDEGRNLYAKRGHTIEPVFGQVKEPRGIRRFTRRGLNACDAEWHLILAGHNLLKLPPAPPTRLGPRPSIPASQAPSAASVPPSPPDPTETSSTCATATDVTPPESHRPHQTLSNSLSCRPCSKRRSAAPGSKFSTLLRIMGTSVVGRSLQRGFVMSISPTQRMPYSSR
jgi:transposase